MTQDSTKSYGDSGLIIATGNKGKRREFARLLDDFVEDQWETYDLETFPETLPKVEETAHSFAGNAIKKALETARASGCCALADDSGLEVEALRGAPGVRSARFAGENASDEDNNRKLLEELQGVAPEERDCRYVAVVCLAMPDNEITRQILARCGLTGGDIEDTNLDVEGRLIRAGDEVLIWFRGELRGRILAEARGEGGFGYDPFFFVPQLDKTMAEVSMTEKNQISHRGLAIEKLKRFFPEVP